MQRSIAKVLTAQAIIDDEGMRLLRPLPQVAQAPQAPHAPQLSIGPFVLLDHYRHQGLRGVGDEAHPHAGIEVVSYLLEGRLEHRDSLGLNDELDAGDAQFIHAGRGILHAEKALSGRHGLQLWLSLPPEQKMDEPSYNVVRAGDIPKLSAKGSSLYVIAGKVNNVSGPLTLTGNGVFARLQMDLGATSLLESDAPELGIYILQGAVRLGEHCLAAGELALLGGGNRIALEVEGEQEVELALIGGEPAKGNILFSGPFVMDTRERLTQAKRDFSAGRMGRLDGVPF